MNEITDNRKQLRRRLALLTGFFTLREEIDGDIAEMMNSLEDVGTLARTPGTPLVNGIRAGRLALPAPDPKSSPISAAGRALALERQRRKAEAEAEPEPEPKALEDKPRGRGRPMGSVGKKKKSRVAPPKIGQLTNTAYIYEWAAAHGGILDLKKAQTDAAKTQHHKNLTVNGRITVAIAEMKRKGFLVHDGNRMGIYHLTPFATEIYNKERERQ